MREGRTSYLNTPLHVYASLELYDMSSGSGGRPQLFIAFTRFLNPEPLSCKAGHNGEELRSNITHSNTTLLMWHVFNEERGACGN